MDVLSFEAQYFLKLCIAVIFKARLKSLLITTLPVLGEAPRR